MKKLSVVMVCLMVWLSVFPVVTFGAIQETSDWAKKTVADANVAGIIPQSQYLKDYTKSIQRWQVADLLVKAYETYTGSTYQVRNEYPFKDGYYRCAHKAYELGFMNGISGDTFNLSGLLTREQMAKVLINFISVVSGKNIKLPINPQANFVDFAEVSDWAKPYVAKAASDGIISGYEDGRFAGGDELSWEMAIALVMRSVRFEKNVVPSVNSLAWDSIISSAKGTNINVSGEGGITLWAHDIVNSSSGISIGTITDSGTIRLGSGVLESNKVYYIYAETNGSYSAPVKVYTDNYTLNCEDFVFSPPGEYKVQWTPVPGVTSYTIKVSEHRNSMYYEEIGPKETITYEIPWATDSFPLTIAANRRYIVEITGGGYTATQEILGESVWNEDVQEIYETYPTTKEEAEKLQVAVTVPIWKMKSNGQKYSSTATIQVHYKIADKVKLVFQEIYDGPEQFPIKDVGGYNWRGSRSEHNGGTAIDINANENYCIYNDGTTIGSHWSPYEDPYSITPYGDVVTAFEKYGFTWGGDAWSNPRDFMHFSYLGT